MQATLAGERMSAEVMPRRQATHSYDDAIADGDAAVLLERLEPGLLCVNLGNLMPGEEGEIVLRFAAPLATADRTARFSLPLVHRPRYGRSTLDPVAEPEHDFSVEHPLQADIRVEGLLARAPVHCATHAARFSVDGETQHLHLGQAMLDRDLVLAFELPGEFSSQARRIRDDDASIGLLTFFAPSRKEPAAPCEVCLVLDGSGSMAGDAIQQSRAALHAIAEELDDEDHVQVLRFGSTVVPLFRRPLKASARVRQALTVLTRTVNADLGGTDIGAALTQAIASLAGRRRHPDANQAVILVTDGAVQPRDIRLAQALAVKADIRIFVVAVGSSAGADVLAPLAAATGAVIERAVPAEPIDACVMRHFRRAREAGPLRMAVDWGSSAARPLPVPVTYPGDAVTAIAMLPAAQDDVTVQVRVPALDHAMSFPLQEPEDRPALRALAGHGAWQAAQDEEREALALRYGLITEQTSAVLVKTRDEGSGAEGLPTVTKVAHMVPEGMLARLRRGETGRVLRMPLFAVEDLSDGYLDVPTFLCRQSSDNGPARRLPEARAEAVRAALRVALERLLFIDRIEGFSLALLMQRIDRALRRDTKRFLAESSITLETRRDAMRLLARLVAQGIGPNLTDDEEAMLAESLATRVDGDDRPA